MGQVTILNNTNVAINSCISAGVNYSWVNKLLSREYYLHNGAAGVYTLNTNFWLGEGSEFANSSAEIGLWCGGIVLGIVGIALAIPTGGTSLALTAAVGGAGLAVSGISLALDDFINMPSKWTNIHALQDRKFIAEGSVEMKRDVNGMLTWENNPVITLHEISNDHFEGLKRHGFVEYRDDGQNRISIPDSYQEVSDIEAAGLLDKPLRVTPALGGNSCWEVEDDQKTEGAAIQLWDRNLDKVYWHLKPEAQPSNALDVFLIYNRALDRYANVSENGRLVSGARTSASNFHIIKVRDSKNNDNYVFQSVTREGLVIGDGGTLGNGTKIRVARKAAGNPSWARWKLTKSGS